MIFSDLLSRQKCDDSNLHKIIPILFNIHSVLYDRYYDTEILGRSMVQM